MPQTTRTRSARSTRTTRRRRRATTTMMRSNVGRAAFNIIKRHAPSLLKFAYSYYCKQPFPDRYDCWLTYDNVGSFATGTATGAFGFALNDIVYPLNKPGALNLKLPFPFAAVTAANPAGLKNILYNNVTSTGLYNQFVVLGTQVSMIVTPGNAPDSLAVSMAPVVGSTLNYVDVVRCGQGPNSVQKVIQFAQGDRTMSQFYSGPSLRGQSYTEYIGDSNNWGSFSTPPPIGTFSNVQWETQAQNTTNNAVNFTVQIKFHCLFFGRVDTGLLDS